MLQQQQNQQQQEKKFFGNFFKLSPLFNRWAEERFNIQLAIVIDKIFCLLSNEDFSTLSLKSLQKKLLELEVKTTVKTIDLALAAIAIAIGYLDGKDIELDLEAEIPDREIIPLRCLVKDNLGSWENIDKEIQKRRVAKCSNCRQLAYALKVERNRNKELKDTIAQQKADFERQIANLETTLKREVEHNVRLSAEPKKTRSSSSLSDENMPIPPHESIGIVDPRRGMVVETSFQNEIIKRLAAQIGFKFLPILSSSGREIVFNSFLMNSIHTEGLTNHQIEKLEFLFWQISGEEKDFCQANSIETIPKKHDKKTIYKLRFYRFLVEVEITESAINIQHFSRRNALAVSQR